MVKIIFDNDNGIGHENTDFSKSGSLIRYGIQI